ncbi:MAG: 1,4-dihydroxy-2-naphthoate octaprenyltransferase [Candidatus Thorarchaeota archaeon]
MTAPDTTESARERPSKIKIWLREIRFAFSTASVVPILFGTAIAWAVTGEFAPGILALTLVAGMFLHFGANVANDYFDHLSGTDDMNVEYVAPFSGGSRVIQEGLLTPREVLAGSFVFFGIAVAIGFYLFLLFGWVIVILGLVGAASGFFYTAPPVRLVSRGIGEVFIGLNFGILMTLGSYFVQTESLSWEPVWASVPVALLIASVLFINEFPDYNADKAAGKLTAVVRLGRRRASRLFAVLMASVYVSIIFAVLLGAVSRYALLGLVTMPLAFVAVRTALGSYDQPLRMVPANVGTIMTHLLTGLFLTAAYVLIGLALDVTYVLVTAGVMLAIVAKLVRDLTRPPPAAR